LISKCTFEFSVPGSFNLEKLWTILDETFVDFLLRGSFHAFGRELLQFIDLTFYFVKLPADLRNLPLVAALYVTKQYTNNSILVVLNDLFVVKKHKTLAYVEVGLLDLGLTIYFVFFSVYSKYFFAGCPTTPLVDGEE